MEKKKVVSFTERIRLVKKVRRILKGNKSYKAFIIISDDEGMQILMQGNFSGLCQIIDETIDKSEKVGKIIKVVAIKRALMDMSVESIDKLPERLKEIMKEIKEEQPSETKEEEVKSEQNQSRNEHAE